MGEDGTEDRLWEDCSGFILLFFKDWRFWAILRNLWMMSILRIARMMIGPTLRNISLITR